MLPPYRAIIRLASKGSILVALWKYDLTSFNYVFPIMRRVYFRSQPEYDHIESKNVAE